jgi:hypothetical protein
LPTGTAFSRREKIIKAANDAGAEEAEKMKTEPLVVPVIRFHDLRHNAACRIMPTRF